MNQQKSKLIKLPEYGEYSLAELERRIHKRGINLIKKANLQSNAELFKLFHDKIKATQYVGFIKIRDHTIQVIPKIFGEDSTSNLHFLLQLLKFTKKISIKEQDLGHLSRLKDDFFEVIIYLFAKNLRDLLRRDFKKSYVNKEENICFLKGKLMLLEQIRANSVDNTKYFCRYEEFTENHMMNQIFKYCADLLIKVSTSNQNKKMLEDILIYLCDVEYVVVNSSDFNKIHFTRLNREYEPLVNLCRLFLENLSVKFSVSKLETFVFMFDMNRLFEEFVFRFIKHQKSRIFVDGTHNIVYIKDQVRLGKLFDEFGLRGDILIQDNSGRKILLDTKYKSLTETKSHYGLSISDFYQMFVYSVSQQQKYKEIVLLYPLPENETLSLDRDLFLHNMGEEEPIKIYIRTIRLTKIFDKEKQRISERDMISELNKALSLAET